MRKKKNLDSRLLACSEYFLDCDTEERNFETAKQNKNYISYTDTFGNSNPVYLEIGCGKGQFVCEMAKRNPQYNYIAVEKVANVAVSAAEKAKRDGLQNVKFIKCGAEYLECFIPERSIAGIYLNFSCPFPKKSYAVHRLTNGRFLEMYKKLLADGAEIHQKTDNRSFFEYSIEEFTAHGFMLRNVSLDLHASDFEDNIVTEYESRFISEGLPIYRLEAVPTQQNKETLFISACLLGAACKYDGKGGNLYNEEKSRKKLTEKYNLVPVCPECLGGLPIPRAPAEIQNGRVISRDGTDVTTQFERGAENVLSLAKTLGCRKALLKANSPSCGFGEVYDGTFSHLKVPGNGITADLLFKNGIMIYNESQLEELL